VNVVIAAVLALVGAPVLATLDGRGLLEGAAPAPSPATFLFWLLAANISLVAFNLIPAFPLDGGRMLRAVLAMFTNYARATAIAATIGQAAAVLLGILGVMSGNFILAIIAVMIFFGAGMESFQAKAKTVLTTLRVGDAYNKHALTLVPADRISRVVDYILTSYQPDFAVVLGGNLLGVVTRDDVLKALAQRPDDPTSPSHGARGGPGRGDRLARGRPGADEPGEGAPGRGLHRRALPRPGQRRGPPGGAVGAALRPPPGAARPARGVNVAFDRLAARGP